jgi:hypothetical protein
MQCLNMTTLFISDNDESFFAEALAKYLFLDKHFKLQIVKVEESLLKAGRPPINRHRQDHATLCRRFWHLPVHKGHFPKVGCSL